MNYEYEPCMTSCTFLHHRYCVFYVLLRAGDGAWTSRAVSKTS